MCHFLITLQIILLFLFTTTACVCWTVFNWIGCFPKLSLGYKVNETEHVLALAYDETLIFLLRKHIKLWILYYIFHVSYLCRPYTLNCVIMSTIKTKKYMKSYFIWEQCITVHFSCNSIFVYLSLGRKWAVCFDACFILHLELKSSLNPR